MELACNPSTAFNQTELSIDLAYYEIAEVPLKWWQKPFKWLADLFNGIPVEAKVILGTLFILASVALAFFSGGGSLVGEAMLGANAAALASAAQVGLIELTIGIGFSVAGWAVSSAMNGSWNFDELTSSVIDGYFLTGVTFFISSSTNYLKFLSRIKPVTTGELKKQVRELTDAELKSFGERGKNQGFRQIIGTHDDAMKFVRSQTTSLQEFAPGKLVGYNSRGVEFRIFPKPNTSYTSIRIAGVDGLKGIKFMWP